MNKPCKSHLSARILIAALAAGLLFTASPAVQAKQSSTDSEWSEWKPMSNGYVARRRVPAKINMPVTQRRLDNVQQRLTKRQRENIRLQVQGMSFSEESDQQEKQFSTMRMRTDGSARGAWKMPSSGAALWFQTSAEGLYSVSIDEIATELGVSAQRIKRKARRGRMQLTNGGHPASWYYDEATGAILFPGEKYDTFYTDQNAYRFKIGRTRTAQSMPVIDGAPGDGFADAAPFTESLTFEEEPDFYYSTWTVAAEQDADYWFWDYLYGGYKDSIEISLNLPDPALVGTGQIKVTLRGWTDLEPGDEHHVYAELNGQSVGSILSWDGFEEAQLVADFDQSILDVSGSNILTLRNVYAEGTHPGQWLDQVDVEYLRMPVAVDNKLWMHDVDGGTQIVTGFTSDDVLVIQSPSGAAAMLGDVQLDADVDGEWSVTFKAVAGADYLLIDRSATAAPVIVADSGTRLAKRRNGAEYLIIAPREFSGTAQALVEYQRDRFDKVRVVWLDDIYNEFSYGRVDPAALASFMQQVQHWRITPSYVVLLGKGTLDEKNRMGYGDSFLPVLMTSTPWSLASSDTRLLGVEDNSEIAVGRIPITNDSEGITYVDKLRTHDAAGFSDELLQAVLVADNPDDAGNFHLNSDLLANRLLDSLGFTGVTKLYHPEDNVRAAFIQSATWNSGYVSYDGHGSAAQVGDYRENFINTVDAAALQNAVYPVFTALTCAVADDTLPGTRSLAGALVLNATGGAIASLAPTGLSLDADAQLLGSAFVDKLYGTADMTIGDALVEAKLQTTGDVADFMPRIYEIVGDPSVYAR